MSKSKDHYILEYVLRGIVAILVMLFVFFGPENLWFAVMLIPVVMVLIGWGTPVKHHSKTHSAS